MAKRRKHKERARDEALALVAAETATAELIPYLDDDADESPVILALVPPDLSRCQCEWFDQSKPTFGPKPLVRCEQPPSVVAFQKRAQDGGEPTGAMSLCEEHRVMIEHMFPGQCYFRKVTSEHKIGTVV